MLQEDHTNIYHQVMIQSIWLSTGYSIEFNRQNYTEQQNRLLLPACDSLCSLMPFGCD